MKDFAEKHKKIISFILFSLYVGCILLSAQETPRKYVAYKATETIKIDGQADEASWKNAPWSELFIDIEGVKKPTYDTQVKMLWDENNIYFFAQMKEPHVWGDITEHDAVIFHNNDFEVFLDPEGDVHGYYELEWNVLNTVWDQYLTAPYRAGNETLNGWEALGMQSAVAVQGTLNDPSDIDEGWTLEIAIPFQDLRTGYYQDNVPKGKFWRVGFSRVNWDHDITDGKYSRKKDPKTGKHLPEYNWVWSPQYVINMHEPERWGYVYFSDNEVGNTSEKFEIPKDDYVKWHLYELYRDLIQQKGKVKWKTADGQIFTEPKLILGKKVIAEMETHKTGFTIWVKSPFSKKTLAVESDGKFRVLDK